MEIEIEEESIVELDGRWCGVGGYWKIMETMK